MGEGDFNHTNTTGSHIGGNHDGAFAGLKFVQDPIALVLLFIAMDGWQSLAGFNLGAKSTDKLTERRPSVLSKEACDIVSNTLGSGED